MDEFVENLKKDLVQLKLKAKSAVAKVTGKPAKVVDTSSTESDATYEINLVPHVKLEMIKAQKIRNLVLFVCILITSVAVGVIVMLAGVLSGQEVAIASQDARLEKLSSKMTEYAGLEDLVMIQMQLAKYDEIAMNKKMPSRVFGALGVLLNQGKDEVLLSDLQVDVNEGAIDISGQADAKTEPLIDYRVLEALKKSAELIKYDYGRYVDVAGQAILAQCITETDADGNALKEGDSYYAWWNLTVSGCEAVESNAGANYESAQYHYSAQAEVEYGFEGYTRMTREVCDADGQNCAEQVYYVLENVIVDEQTAGDETSETDGNTSTAEENGETAEGNDETIVDDGIREWTEEELGTPKPLRVKIWRTPQFADWYGKGFMKLNGTIVGVEHFDSECYNYTGTLLADNSVHWNSTNDCLLIPDGLDITESSNARNDSGELVLKFAASLEFVPEFFEFANKHMIAIGPMGQNVTDSYLQIGGMFAQEARDCAVNDKECLGSLAGVGGEDETEEEAVNGDRIEAGETE